MAEVRASHLRLVVNEPQPVAVRVPRLRFQPVVRLADGAAFGLQVQTDIAFEDTFQMRHLTDAPHPSAAAWLGDLIERAANLAHDADYSQRPISILAPMAALADPDTPMACEAGARRSKLLPRNSASTSQMDRFATSRIWRLTGLTPFAVVVFALA